MTRPAQMRSSPSVFATITDCEWNADGTATIVLDRKVRIVIENPPCAAFDAVVGVEIEAVDGLLMVASVPWARAVKYGKRRMRLIRRVR